jgi:hypothetical protein
MAREMKEHELVSPVDLPAEPIAIGRALGWTSVAISVATAALLCANAETLSGWIDAKPPSALQLRASQLADGWSSAMTAIGVTAPSRAIHRLWKETQEARFGDEAPGGTQ